MNNQQAFDTMVQHLRKQRQKSRNSGCGTCLYRGPDGLKCAVGVLIPDELYSKEMEGQAIDRLLISERNTFPELSKLFDGVNELLLDGMQDIHDFHEPDRWESHFKSIADEYNLNYTAPKV
jgi:hypothetical protein